eukprot:scaffold387_cov266-Chaetoceros_neogracile.AAC.23
MSFQSNELSLLFRQICQRGQHFCGSNLDPEFVGVRSLLSTEVSQRNHADVKQVKKQHQFPGTFS